MGTPFDRLCRACMSDASNVQSLFSTEENQKPLSDLLEFVVNMPITKNDKLPQNVCIHCRLLICKAASFKRKYLDSQRILKSLNNEYLDKSSELLNGNNIEFNKLPQPGNFEDDQWELNCPYQCSICYMQYSDMCHLETHVETHRLKIKKNMNLRVTETLSTSLIAEPSTCDSIKEEFADTLSDHDSLTTTCSQNLDNPINHCKAADNRDDNFSCEKQYVCTTCETVFHKKKLLRNHLQYTHLDSDTKNITSQDYDDGARKTIIKAEPSTDNHNCIECNLQIETLGAFNDHMKHKHKIDFKNENKLRDSNSLTSRQEEGQNVRSNADQYFECLMCSRKFVKMKSFEAHMKNHKDNTTEVHICQTCKREFKHRAHLDNHVTSVHSSSKGFKCPICAKGFSTEESLNLHQSCHQTKKHQCKFCDKGFNMLSTLKDHTRTHTGEKPFLCSTCGRGFSQKTNLKEHMKRHQGFKPYKCQNCEQRFVSKGELVAHNRKHSGAHPFICDTCGSGFTTSSSLVKHRRIHTGERPYDCDLCSMKFAVLGTLKNHRRTHTGEKPYQCSYCEKAFIQKNDLVSHIRCHTGERPYVCSTCSQTFRQCSALKTHLKVHTIKDPTSLVPLQPVAKENLNKLLSLQGLDTLTMMSGVTNTASGISS